jgi:predicted AAA+ superfamily ATPase
MDDDKSAVERFINLPALVEKKSYFLLGPRQTGKTFLVRRALPHARKPGASPSTIAPVG